MSVKLFFRLPQASQTIHLAIRSIYDFSDKEGLVLVRGFSGNGAEVQPASGTTWSKTLGGYFIYIPSGSHRDWIEFAQITYANPIRSVRLDGVDWRKSGGKSIDWNDLGLRLIQPVVQKSCTPNAIAIGSFDVLAEKIN